MTEEAEPNEDVDTIELVQIDDMDNKEEQGEDDQIQKMSNYIFSFFGF